MVFCSSIALVRNEDTVLGESCVSDLTRLTKDLMVSLTFKEPMAKRLRLLEVLGECKGVAYLDLSNNKRGDGGEVALAGVLKG